MLAPKRIRHRKVQRGCGGRDRLRVPRRVPFGFSWRLLPLDNAPCALRIARSMAQSYLAWRLRADKSLRTFGLSAFRELARAIRGLLAQLPFASRYDDSNSKERGRVCAF